MHDNKFAPGVEETFLEQGLKIRSSAQEHMVAVSSGALALSVTFSGAIAQHSPAGMWLLRSCWLAFALCVVLVVLEKIGLSRVLLDVLSDGPPDPKKHKLGRFLWPIVHYGSLVAFAAGIVAMAAFGLANLGHSASGTSDGFRGRYFLDTGRRVIFDTQTGLGLRWHEARPAKPAAKPGTALWLLGDTAATAAVPAAWDTLWPAAGVRGQ